MSVRFNFESDIRFLTGRGALRNAAIVMDNMGCRRVINGRNITANSPHNSV